MRKSFTVTWHDNWHKNTKPSTIPRLANDSARKRIKFSPKSIRSLASRRSKPIRRLRSSELVPNGTLHKNRFKEYTISNPFKRNYRPFTNKFHNNYNHILKQSVKPFSTHRPKDTEHNNDKRQSAAVVSIVTESIWQKSIIVQYCHDILWLKVNISLVKLFQPLRCFSSEWGLSREALIHDCPDAPEIGLCPVLDGHDDLRGLKGSTDNDTSIWKEKTSSNC